MRATWKRIAALACAGLACSTAHARPDFPETEANDTKAAANAVTLAVGDSVSGTTTGTSTITAGNGSADYYRVKTSPAALGIYRQRLDLNSTTLGQTAAIQGLSQTSAGVGTTDSVFLSHTTSIAAGVRSVVWYGFGKEEEIYYRVTGASTSTATYTSTFVRDLVFPYDFTSATIYAGNVTIGPATGNTGDIDWWLYDSNLNAIPCAGMDSGAVTGVRTLNLAAGTYYLAAARYQAANNLPTCAPDTWFTGLVADFPNVFLTSSTAVGGVWDIKFTSSAGEFSTSGLTTTTQFEVPWIQIHVTNAPNPSGTGIATPAAVPNGGSTELKITVNPGGTGTLDDIANPPQPSGVRVDVATLSGNASPDWLYLVRDGISSDWKTTYIIPPTAAISSYTLPFELTQGGGSPGTNTGSIALAVVPPPPANDTCAGAELITALPYTSALVDYSVATVDTDANPSCDISGNSAGANRGVWWSYTATVTSSLLVQRSSPTSDDTVTSVWTGSCGALTQLASGGCVDGDAAGFAVAVTSGTTYYIMVSKYAATAPATGTQVGVIVDILLPPANDLCSTAEVVSAVPYVSPTVRYAAATTDTNANPSCDASGNSAGANRGVWWAYTPAESGIMSVLRNSPSSEDTVTSVWTGADCNSLTQVATNGCLDGDSTTFGVSVVGGTTYYVMVSKFATTVPAATVEVGVTLDLIVTPANDLCSAATVISGVPYVSPVVGYMLATTDANANPSCDSTSNTAGAKYGIWWTYTPTVDGIMTVQRNSPSSEDTVTSVWTGADCNSLTQIATNGCVDSDATTFNIVATSGVTYYIMVSKYGTGAPTVSARVGVTVDFLPPIGVCCNTTTGVCAVTTSSCPVGSVLSTATTTCGPTACPVTGTCCHDTNGLCTLVYGGGACPTGTTQTGSGTACVPNPCPSNGSCCNGNTCTVVLETNAGSCGVFTLNGVCTPSNPCFLSDNCETTDLIALMGTQVGTTVDSTTSFQITPGTLCAGVTTSSGGYNDVFLKFVAPATATYTLDTCGPSALDTILSIHSGPCATISSSASVLACNDDAGYPVGVGIACVGAGTTLTSRILSVNLVAGTEYYVRIGAFLTTSRGAFTLNIDYVAGTQVGTCCSGSTCTITDAANCSGGTHTVGAVCESNPCGPATEFCCRGTTCVSVSAGTCVGTVNGTTALVTTSCGAGNSTSSCCFADYSHTNGLTIDDLFLYLNGYFASSPYANMGGDGVTAPNIDDLFLYINAYFNSCQP